ncbi:MAG: SDR family oxidoreductase [Gammaproteobacteria bacterium]|nr:SDR family oxidoreductase [Gammaproteobacteria bacterium]
MIRRHTLFALLTAGWLLNVGITSTVLADVLVFGGTRGVGLETVRHLRESGETVTVMVRKTSDLTALNAIDGVSTTIGDAMVPEEVVAAFASGEFDAAVSSLGGTLETDVSVDSVGNINAIDGAKAAGVDRFILVSSIGAGDSRAGSPKGMLRVLGPVLVEKEKSERHLIDSGLKWTIMRPGVLKDDPATGKGILTQDTSVLGMINRAELARLIGDAIGNEETFGRIYTAIEER